MGIKKWTLLCAGISIAAAAPVKADTRDEVLAGIQRCGVIRDDRTWLDCIYGANQPMRTQLGLPPAPEFQQRLVPAIQPGTQPGITPPPLRSVARPAPRKKPGFFATLLGETQPVAVSKMASYRYEKNGAFIVALENGQEWRQTDVDGGTASWMKPPSTYTVTITPGAFGSYSLHTSDNPRVYKVEPVK
ncbi:MAG TPA: hypothetical protein VNN98_03850 [Rhizomicrobium sp.]|nr:hypothetical protein [Rhizomicrobium sp.]